MLKTLHSSIAQELPPGAPEWIHLLPAGTFSGADGRGPYEAGDGAAVVAAFTRKLPIDENHAIDLAGKAGGATPSRGWIVELQARPDGVWGRVEWTEEGRRLVEGKAYGFISPVFTHPEKPPFTVAALHRAALTNDPNLTSLTSLHTKEHAVLEELKKALGLSAAATEAEVLAAVTAAHTRGSEAAATIARLAEAAGAAKDAGEADIVTAINTRNAGKPDEVATLKAELTALNTRFVQVTTAAAKKDAEAAIDEAIKEGKVVPALRDHMIARHMKDPAEVAKEIGLMVSINAGGLRGYKPPENAGDGALSSDEAAVCAMMGLDPKAFAETAKTIARGA